MSHRKSLSEKRARSLELDLIAAAIAKRVGVDPRDPPDAMPIIKEIAHTGKCTIPTARGVFWRWVRRQTTAHARKT